MSHSVILHSYRKESIAVALLTAALSGLASVAAQAEDSYQAWRQIYNQDPNDSASENATAIAMDSHGNVAVTGYAFAGDNSNSHLVFYTVKYDGLDGHIIWEQRYDSGVDDCVPNAITCDSSGNVIVTGGASFSHSGNINKDLHTIKYRSTDGAVLWSENYNGTADGDDQGVKVVVDSLDNVIVTAKSAGTSSGYDFFTIKYPSGGGTPLWTGTRFDGPGHNDDVPTGLGVDGSDNVYVTGTMLDAGLQKNFYTAKYQESNGALLWSRTYTGAEDSGANALAVTSGGVVVVTGYTGNGDGTTSFFTRSYNSGGTLLWTATQDSPGENFTHGAMGVVIDGFGNAIVTGTLTDSDIFDSKIYYTVKYSGGGLFGPSAGTVLWHQQSTPPDNDDEAVAIAIDGSDNVIVTGLSYNPNHDSDYDTFKYANADGSVLWERRYTGVDKDGSAGATDNLSCGGDDVPVGLAVDGLGNVAVTGDSYIPFGELTIQHHRYATMKYNLLIAQTGDPIAGGSLPDNAKISGFSAPAMSDTQISFGHAPSTAIASEVTISAGKSKFSAILGAGGGAGTYLPAVQKDQAPDANGSTDASNSPGLFKSFYNPIMSPNGSYAFGAKLTASKGQPSAGVWTTTFTGALTDELVMALGVGSDLHDAVAAVPAGTKIASVLSTSLKDGQLLALLKVTGATKGNVLVCLTSPTTGELLLKTGQSVMVGSSTTTVKSFAVLAPSAGTAGDGRWQGLNRVLAKVTLADKRTAIFSLLTSSGAYTPVLYTGQDASGIVNGATWKSFGSPSIGGFGFYFANLGTLEPLANSVSSSNDTVLAFSVAGSSYAPFAREGQVAPSPSGTETATYAGFLDPLINDFETVAYIGTLKGSGVTSKNKTAIWAGPVSSIARVARTGDMAPVPFDAPASTAEFSGFTSMALQDGTSTGPIFLAKLGGKGVNGKNNVGLYGVDLTGALRQLIRNGDLFSSGEADADENTPAPFRTVTSISLLQALPESLGAGRSYNGTGGITLLVKFKDKTEALLDIGLP